MNAKPVTLATWNRPVGNDFGGTIIRATRVAVLSETAQGDVTVVELREDGDWSGVTFVAYADEIESRRQGVASPSGRIFEVA